jgi:hypothetical protein
MFVKGTALTLLPTFFSVCASLALNAWTPLKSTSWPFALIFLLVLSIAFNVFFYLKRFSPDFTRLLIGGVALRMLLSLIFLTIVWYFMGAPFLHFAVHFLIHYVLFAAAEIRYLSLLQKSTVHP